METRAGLSIMKTGLSGPSFLAMPLFTIAATIRYWSSHWSSPAVGRGDPQIPRIGAEMARVLYTAEAAVTGGRASGHGRTNDGALDVQLRTPKEMGGEGGGTNPEQLFAVGYAACFESALGVVGRRERAEVGDVSIGSRVSLLPTEERGFKLAVELDVTLPQVQDPEQAARIVAAAHQVCPYSNATRGNIDVTLTANGHEVG
jgi:Ohr subfamily peroxiredoxin